MADEAVRSGARIGVCGALAPAMETTLRLLEDSAGKAGRSCRFTPVHFEDARDRFKAGRLGAYHERIAEGLARAAADHDVLVLAQASIAHLGARLEVVQDIVAASLSTVGSVAVTTLWTPTP